MFKENPPDGGCPASYEGTETFEKGKEKQNFQQQKLTELNCAIFAKIL